MSNQQIQKVKVKKLAHVGLWATDVPAQARFYRQVLGCDLRLPSDSTIERDIDLEDANVFLALGEEHHSLALFNDIRPTSSNGRRAAARTQLHHLSFEVDSDAELAALAARLSDARRISAGERATDAARAVATIYPTARRALYAAAGRDGRVLHGGAGLRYIGLVAA